MSNRLALLALLPLIALAPLLAGLQGLSVLALSNNGIRSEGARALAGPLAAMTGLQVCVGGVTGMQVWGR